MVIRLGCVVLAVCASAYGFQTETGANAEREKDVYAIYSLLFTNTETSHGADTNERYLIAATTSTRWPSEPTPACVAPPAGRQAEFREVLADYELRKSTPRQLKRQLSIQKPYVLLDDEEVKAFMKTRPPTVHPDTSDERFRGVADVFMLSEVYFNPSRTLALTAFSSWCGGLCAKWQWRVFEKSATGKWEERHWITCITVAEGPRSMFRVVSGQAYSCGRSLRNRPFAYSCYVRKRVSV
jgi:hypothetical protein